MKRKPIGFIANINHQEIKDVEFEDVKKQKSSRPNLYSIALQNALSEFVENERHNISLSYSLPILEEKLKAAALLYPEDKERFISFKWSDLATTI
ncbi:MAG: hypothetical protein Q4G63_10025 [Bacteroidia bacterium]|nr:hypothetical protein [Bacteroidia bacterium]